MGNPRRIPISLLDSSPFESREQVTPLESTKALGTIVPPLVRPVDGRFEIVAGHRRVESARKAGLKTILCSVKHFDDRKAAILHFAENVDRAELSALAKGRFFQRYMKKFRVSERETAKILGVSPSQISLCVGLAETSEGVFRGLNRPESESLEPVVTMTKYAAVSALPTRQKVAVLREAVRRRLSDSETRRVAAEVRSGKNIELAASSVVEARRDRTRKPDAAAGSASGRVICSNCRRPVIIEHLGNGRHRILADVR